MGRRPKGSGSIYTRKDGTVVGQYEVDTLNGKKRKYIRGKSKKDVASRLAKAISDRDSGLVFDSGSLTLSGYLDKWLKVIQGTISVGSWKQYETIVRLHIKPALGKLKLDRVTALHVQNLYREKLDFGLTPRRVIYIHVTLHKALKQAVRWSLIPRNVTDAVEPPKARKKEILPLDQEQVRRLMEAARGNKLEALYVLAVNTGMRQGELLGLQWRDVDLDSGTLRVNRTIFGGVVSPPKTARSRRSIKMSRSALVALKAHEKKSEWVFSTASGKPIDCTNLTKQSWKPLLKEAGLPNKRFHDLRHTCATLLLTKGVHPKVVQELLGHSSISITLDTYSHVLPNMQEKAVAAMDEIFE
jgi:integrase